MKRLIDEPYRFEFFQAVRLFGIYFKGKGKEKGKPKGIADGAAREPIRFGNSLSLSFPPSEIESLEVQRTPTAPGAVALEDGSPEADATIESVKLIPSFIGLTGNVGTLPRHYTETLLNRESINRDRTPRAFLDIFTDRAVMQFYRAWLKYRLHFQYEVDRQNRYLPILLSLTGLGSPAMRSRLLRDDGGGVLDESLAFYAGILRNAGKSGQSVEQLLSDYLRVPVKLEQFIGRWFDVPAAQCTALGGKRGALGAGALCGTRVWQRENRVRLQIGPLDKPEFDDLLPGGNAASSLGKLLGMLTGVTLEYEVQLILHKNAVEAAALTSENPVRLGLDGWMMTQAPTDHVRDACFEVVPQFH